MPKDVPTGTLCDTLRRARELILSQQSPEGYWWYTLEANESIGSGYIQIMHFLGEIDRRVQSGLIHRMLSEQRPDGSWALYYGGEGDLSTTVECYFALKLAGHPPSEAPLEKARQFILGKGGLTKIRAFTRIHLALFEILPWSLCPAMPIWFMLLPPWCGVSIYEFSSWARASIVPLLLLYETKPARRLPFTLDELYVEKIGERKFEFPKSKKLFSLENFFVRFDKVLKLLEKFSWHPGKKKALKKAESWVREHIERTEDIYPAMGYAIMGLSALGYQNNDPTIQKALRGLRRFQQAYSHCLPAKPECDPPKGGSPDPKITSSGGGRSDACFCEAPSEYLHQQCCISPNWDTPWVGVALMEAGLESSHPQLLKSARYLLKKQIKFTGDWRFKNKEGVAGGWSFEFQNDYFPDVDDTIEAIFFLLKVDLPPKEKEDSIQRALQWCLSMQSHNGGWAAFDKDNVSQWVNRIPFSDHGACLDSPTPDITGRMLELLAHFDYQQDHSVVSRALSFIYKHQEENGSWRGRWGVNYIYGTWCVLQGLAAIGEDFGEARLQKAVQWVQSIQNPDGGWGESCLSDVKNHFVPQSSTASQTAWAILALLAAQKHHSPAVKKGIQWLTDHQNEEGGWDEPCFTGTGFPGHFYIRYHGYRHYFPLLALGKYGCETNLWV